MADSSLWAQADRETNVTRSSCLNTNSTGYLGGRWEGPLYGDGNRGSGRLRVLRHVLLRSRAG